MYQLTNSHAPTGTAMYTMVATSPSRTDWPRSLPTKTAMSRANVTRRTSAPAARVAFAAFPARVCQIRACTIRSTFSSARVASNSANAATTNETTRSVVERSPTLDSAFAASPPIPASRASELAS